MTLCRQNLKKVFYNSFFYLKIHLSFEVHCSIKKLKNCYLFLGTNMIYMFKIDQFLKFTVLILSSRFSHFVWKRSNDNWSYRITECCVFETLDNPWVWKTMSQIPKSHDLCHNICKIVFRIYCYAKLNAIVSLN